MSVMDIFGLIMLLCMLQLLIIGSVIQRGKENWIPENMKKRNKKSADVLQIFWKQNYSFRSDRRRMLVDFI